MQLTRLLVLDERLWSYAANFILAQESTTGRFITTRILESSSVSMCHSAHSEQQLQRFKCHVRKSIVRVVGIKIELYLKAQTNHKSAEVRERLNQTELLFGSFIDLTSCVHWIKAEPAWSFTTFRKHCFSKCLNISFYQNHFKLLFKQRIKLSSDSFIDRKINHFIVSLSVHGDFKSSCQHFLSVSNFSTLCDCFACLCSDLASLGIVC